MDSHQSDYINDIFDQQFSDLIIDDNESNHQFCSSENNINQCLLFLSRELISLGYPSIYDDANIHCSPINCDMVEFLNVIYDLIQKHNNHIKARKDLLEKNNILDTDLNMLHKKISQVKNTLEQSEKKYSSAVERERQLKEKLNQIITNLKNEKEEVKKLNSQLQQQKLAYQHEIRKKENSIVQMKAKFNQLLSDKNPDKKCAKIESSNVLQRVNGQRGKWKTGTVANSRLEEMYNSIISGYETKSKDMLNEMKTYFDCLKFVQDQLTDILALFQDKNVMCDSTSECFSLNAFGDFYLTYKHSKLFQDSIKEKFNLLKSTIHQYNNNSNTHALVEEINFLRNKLAKYESSEKDNETNEINEKNDTFEKELKPIQEIPSDQQSYFLKEKELLQVEREKIQNEKIKLLELAASIEKKKEALEFKKLDILKLEMSCYNNISRSQNQSINFMPAISVITTRDGIIKIPSASHITGCLNDEHQATKNFASNSNILNKAENRWFAKQENTVLQSHTFDNNESDVIHSKNNENIINELPKWVTNAKNSVSPNESIQHNEVQRAEMNSALESSDISSLDCEVANTSCEDFSRLQIVADDIQQKWQKRFLE